MSDAVVVVGPNLVRGPGHVDAELVSVALECIDDGHALLDDVVLPAAEVWRSLLGSAMGGPCDGAVLICPSWWSSSRLERVEAAARDWCDNVVIRQRVDLLATSPTVLEIAPELVVVHAGGQRHAIVRTEQGVGVVDAIAACVHGLDPVVLDVPSGLARFGADLARTLRSRSVDVTVVGDDVLVAGAVAQCQPPRAEECPTTRRGFMMRAVVPLAVVLALTTLTAAGMAIGTDPEDDVAWLVEGRVAVQVPARWTVERITSGPGSARVQMVSPSEPRDAIHVTQSLVPETQTLDETAATLRAALAEEPDGVFVDFTVRAEPARRAAVTYREIRADRRISWTVLLDGGVRIAIGCQGAVDEPGPGPQCERSIASAHSVR